MLLSVLVVANGHMAEAGVSAEGLPSNQAYLIAVIFLQSVILLWALVASEAIWPRKKPG